MYNIMILKNLVIHASNDNSRGKLKCHNECGGSIYYTQNLLKLIVSNGLSILKTRTVAETLRIGNLL